MESHVVDSRLLLNCAVAVQILGTTDETASFVYAELDYAEMETRRLNMPLTQQKRYELYSLVDKT